ncbi:hypothetical protein COU77_00985, partial [Candidatus Peregrinibacteria bacterium CG10_big_fil_rev_8_21_14_0_10_49_16]
DGVVDRSEQCDDGNRFPGDGCTPYCFFEIPGEFYMPIPPGQQFDPRSPYFAGQPGAVVPASIAPQIGQDGVSVPGTQPETGPVAIAVIAAGAAGGLAWVRRRRNS